MDTNDAGTRCLLGMIHFRKGDTNQAIALLRAAIARRPDFADAHNNLGVVLEAVERLDEAAACYHAALQQQPVNAEAHYNLANILARQNRWEEAVESYQTALRFKATPSVYANMGNALKALGRMDEAVAAYDSAIALQPEHADAHFNLALASLAMGNFGRGWDEYRWRWKCPGATLPPFPIDVPNSLPLAGQPVFLYGEYGLGDELFFLRFVASLRQHGITRITYRPAPKIASLLVRTKLTEHLAGSGEAPQAGEAVISIGDLPRLLGQKTVDSIPPPLPLAPLTARVLALQERLAKLGPPPYVGITWRAGTKDRERALYKESPFPRLAEALKAIPATVLVLQRNPLDGEIDAFSRALGRPAHDLSALNDDLESILALLSLIDEYVGVSNTNMHLRAGVGKTARVLVPSPPEWRWMAEGKESPWFPGFTVYRQGYNQSWETAFTKLQQDLCKTFENAGNGPLADFNQ